MGHLPPVQTTFDGPLVAAIAAAVDAEDPGARLLPYLLPASTDAKAFSASASGTSASRRCGCRRTWTSPRCSTASTSGCRWTRYGSAAGSCTACC